MGKQHVKRGGDCFLYRRTKNDSEAGAGVYSLNPIGNLTTVYEAEIFALMKCIEALKGEKIVNETIYVCTDSQASLEALEIYLTWVPEHRQ